MYTIRMQPIILAIFASNDLPTMTKTMICISKPVILFYFCLSAFLTVRSQSDTSSGNRTGKVATYPPRLFAQDLKVKVADRLSGYPIPGATIHVLNTQRTASADAGGQFSFVSLPEGKYICEISALGYATTYQEVSIKGVSVYQAAKSEAPFYLFLLDRSASRLDEIVVTAQKKEEISQKVPIALTALTARQVREYRLWDIKDITAIAPALYAADPGDDRNVTSLRGIVSTSYDPAVATYIDGVNQFGLDTYIANLFDVERIEVLRGPQGTLYGRNAMGGVINIITRQPSNQADGFAGMDFGNYGRQRYSAGLRLPLVKDRLYIGAAGVFDRQDGFYTNTFNNKPFDTRHSFTGNYYLRWLPGAHWSLSLNVKHHNNRNDGPFPSVIGVDEAFLHPFTLSQNAVTTMVDNTLNASLSVSYTGARFNFSSQSAYQSNNRYYKQPIDGDFSPLDGISLDNNFGRNWNVVKALTQDFKFTSPASSSSPWKWTAGAYLFYQDAPNKQATIFGMDANLLGTGDSLFALINTSNSYRWGAALYGQMVYALSPTWNLTIGGRYDHEHQYENILGEYRHAPLPDIMVVRPDTSGKTSFGAFSPKLSLDHQITGNSLLYAVYSRGFRTGGLTGYSSDQNSPPLQAFRPEYSSNYEIGIKNSWLHNALRFNADLFYSLVSDAQVPTLVLPDAITVTRNTGRLDSKGVEAELFAAPLKGLIVGYSFGYTNARFKDLKLSQNGAVLDLAGKRQVFTPDITSMLSVQYTYAFGGGGKWKALVRGEWKHLGTTYFDQENFIRQDPYDLYNTRLGILRGNWELMFWGRNLGNKRYIGYAYDFGSVHLGNPRTTGVSMYVRWR